MSRRAIANFCLIPGGVFLLVIGVVHGVVNVSGMRRAIARGDIAPRLADASVANAGFSGLAMTMLGLLVFLALPGLRAGNRWARRVATAIGIFVGALGAAGFLWAPTKPAVLIFLFFGALLAAPLWIWRREFSSP